MRGYWNPAGLGAGVLLLAASAAVWAEEPAQKVPAPVTKTLAEQFNGLTIKELKRKTKDFEEVYEFRFAGEDEKDFKVLIGEKGAVVKEDEHALPEAKVPERIREAYRLWCGGKAVPATWSVKRPEGSLRVFRTSKAVVLGKEDYFMMHVPEDLGALDLKQYARGDAVKEFEEKKSEDPAKTGATAATAESAKEPEIDPDVINKVRKLIKGTLKEDVEARTKAWEELRDMGNLAVPGLVALYRLDTTTAEMVRSIVIALGDSKDKRAGPALVEILGSKDASIRAKAARAIGDANYKEGIGALKERLFDAKEAEDVKLFAATSAAKLGSASGAESLKALMASEAPAMRARATYALGKFAGKEHVAAIAGALKDPDDQVRMDAVEALRIAGGKDPLGPLVEATKDENYKVRGAAMDALRDLSGQKFGNEPKEWQDWWAKENAPKDEARSGEKKSGEAEEKDKTQKIEDKARKLETEKPEGWQPPGGKTGELPKPNPDKSAP